MKIFNKVYLYVKISTNQIELTNLSTGESLTRKATENFSTNRIVLASFIKIETLIQSMLKELKVPTSIFTRKEMLIQQTEKVDGGLADIEKRALREIGEQSGALYVIIVEHATKLSIEEALIELKTVQQ